MNKHFGTLDSWFWHSYLPLTN